jgi:AcrR family transcriptional regulator
MASGARKHRSATTATRLLDAAERLFGEHGYNGVGLRALAGAAHVNLAATTYHFGSKKALYVETFFAASAWSMRSDWRCSGLPTGPRRDNRSRWSASWSA